MVIVKLWGGLGNQMFQYAAAKALSVRYNVPLKLDNGHFKNNINGETAREYSLQVFPGIKEPIATATEITKLAPFYKYRLLNSAFKKINQNFLKLSDTYKAEKYPPDYSIKPGRSKLFYLDGYWQSEEYFEDCKELIEQCFSLNHLIADKSILQYIKLIQTTASVSIHLRRGDYASSPATLAKHGLLDIHYYKKAIECLQKKLIPPPHYFIFSDDIEWCRQNLTFVNKPVFINTGYDYKDLFLMSLCNHNIIANSTFSWWAAWLNKNKNKIVVAPKKWHAHAMENNIVPSNWLIV